FFFSSRRRHTRFSRDWSSDVCSSDLLVRAFESAGAANDLDVAPLEIALVNPVQPLDVRVAAGLELRPVVPPDADVEAVIGRVGHRVTDLGRAPHDLLRHAADVHARAAEAARLE